MCLFIYLGFDLFPIEGNFIIQRKEKGGGCIVPLKWMGEFPSQLSENRSEVLNFEIEIWSRNFNVHILICQHSIWWKFILRKQEYTYRYFFFTPAFYFVQQLFRIGLSIIFNKASPPAEIYLTLLKKKQKTNSRTEKNWDWLQLSISVGKLKLKADEVLLKDIAR